MLFASCLRHEYLYYYDKVKGKKGDVSDSEEEEEKDKAKESTAVKDAEPFADDQ